MHGGFWLRYKSRQQPGVGQRQVGGIASATSRACRQSHLAINEFTKMANDDGGIQTANLYQILN